MTCVRRSLSVCLLSLTSLLLLPVCLTSHRALWVWLWAAPGGVASGHLLRVPRQLSQWASWNSWSTCSRSCGGGASVRWRSCMSRNPVEGVCPGEGREYKICNTQVCPVGSEDFREIQCSAFNGRPLVDGSAFRWTTFHGGSDPCELSCLAVGQNFYYNFGHVLDGTSCSEELPAICVRGRCLAPGCDQVLGSQRREDACRVCGGNNSTCLHHQSVYHHGGVFGYNEVAMIPAGATNIKVTENSRNYLALQDQSFVFLLNGGWRISSSGQFSAAGVKLLYRRSADTWETIDGPGPTQEDLHLLVLVTDSTPGVFYEYWLPPEIYALYHGPRSPLRQQQHSASYPARQIPFSTTLPAPAPPAPTLAPQGNQLLKPNPPHSPILPRLEREDHPLTHPGRCGKCRRGGGRARRRGQYCVKDFVFRAKVLGRWLRGQETRYDVQIIHTYRNRFHLEHREFLWVPNTCCPLLVEGRQYVVMARRHINYERTLNRILLEEGSYVVPYSPREDTLLRPLEALCGNPGFQRL